MNEFEELWDRLLSRDPELILPAFNSMQPDEQGLILTHLSRMIEEEGWQPSQRESARTALEVIHKNQPDGISS